MGAVMDEGRVGRAGTWTGGAIVGCWFVEEDADTVVERL